MQGRREESLMDVMGRLLTWAIIIVVVCTLVFIAAPLVLIPVVVIGAIILIAWNEAKVPLGRPESFPSKHRPPVPVPRHEEELGAPMVYSGYVEPPPPLELEPERRTGPAERRNGTADRRTGPADRRTVVDEAPRREAAVALEAGG